MIKVKKGKVMFKGSATEILSELSVLCRDLKEALAVNLQEHIAKELVMSAAEIGLKSDEELHDAVQDIIKKFINKEGEKYYE